jgi:hypothetical protein
VQFHAGFRGTNECLQLTSNITVETVLPTQTLPKPPPDPYVNLHPLILSVLYKNIEVFAPLTSLPPDRHIGHTIPLVPGHPPPYRPKYRMSPTEREEVKKAVADLLSKGFIEPSKSPYGAPILFVQKKDGSLRAVFDYLMLNAITARDRSHCHALILS